MNHKTRRTRRSESIARNCGESQFRAILSLRRVRLVLWFIVYIILPFSTRAAFVGDMRGYTTSILEFTRGEGNSFWEFGHLLWRPTGWLVFRIVEPLTSLFLGPDHLY